jgi:predicted DNA-binding transcriptional regulator YafY
MLKILFLLLSRKKVSAKFLADRFELSVRTVYRYIDELSLAGVPIYNERGRNGGYSISDTYKLPANYLNEEEIENVINALSGINNDLRSNVLESAILKISAITKPVDNTSALSFGNLVIDGTAWGSSDNYSETLKVIQKAIEENLLIQIEYLDRDGKTSDRIIEPHVLALKQGLWYAYSYCHERKDFRLFKIGRIHSLKITSENFIRRDISDMNEVFSKWYGETEEDIDLSVEKSAVDDVIEWLGVDKISSSPSGKITASTRLPINDYLTAKILSFGNKVKVLSPKKLKDAVLKTARSIEDLYK